MNQIEKTDGKTSTVANGVTEIAKQINTAKGIAIFVRTSIEDANERWDGMNLSTKDGFYIIHNGNKHHIYTLLSAEEYDAMSERESEKRRGN